MEPPIFCAPLLLPPSWGADDRPENTYWPSRLTVGSSVPRGPDHEPLPAQSSAHGGEALLLDPPPDPATPLFARYQAGLH